jgi:KUP system potassium uptake protein
MKVLFRPNPGESYWAGIVKSMGLVFGDIGTSPIYTLTVLFTLTRPTPENILGVLSLIFWTLIILVTVQYAWLAMSLGYKGQGGGIMLRETLLRVVKKGRKISIAGVLTYLGVSLLLGDGVITPAISILSAVEGTLLIPGLENLGQNSLILFASGIAIALFSIQSYGTDKISWTFGPVMIAWFLTLSISGLTSIISTPEIFRAVSPVHAVIFFQQNGFMAFIVLSDVVLCATGSEALFADMGHIGRWPIIRAWMFVFVALTLNYLGQGVFAMHHPEAKHFLFSMVQAQVPFLYVPFLVLTILATIIASQAMISGVFSIVYQGITTRLMPLLKVKYTSSKLQSQIYIGGVNWFLLGAVLFVMLIFRESTNLAAAYGLAVMGSMTTTSIMMVLIFSRVKRWKLPVAVAVCAVDFVYLFSTFSKIPHGAYWSLVIAAIPLTIMIIWTFGQKILYRSLRPLGIDVFLISYEQIYATGKVIPGTALFFTRDWRIVPPYVTHCILRGNIIYERNIFISITRTDEPFGVEVQKERVISKGLESFEIRAGFQEIVDIESILKQSNIFEKVIFYGIEDIVTSNPIWHIFSYIKKNTPNFVQFYKLPPSKLQGVVTRLEI